MSPETKSTGTSEPGRSSASQDKQIAHRKLLDDSGQDYFVVAPSEVGAKTPLLVAVHDISRNAQEQAKAFASLAQKYKAVLVAPHFAADRYPNYQRLGRSRNSLARGRRADATLDSILQEVASSTGVSASRIHLFGYGAGGRFALRYAMAHPDRVAGAVIASAGTYTMPDAEKRFPQGIAPGPARPDLRFDPERFLRVPMTVFAGKRRGPPRKQRTLESVERRTRTTPVENGRQWVSAMKAAAKARGLESVVSYREVDDSIQSFKSFARKKPLIGEVFETLFGPRPGQTAKTPDAASRVASKARAVGVPTTSDAVETAPETRWDRLRGKVVPILLGAVVLALLTPVVLWVHYRSTHVVAREAMVRGHIAEVGARLNGVVKSVEVDTGDRVTAGQIVARLEDSHFQARLRQARSQLEKSTRELEVEHLAIANERQRLVSSLKGASAGLSAAGAQVRASDGRAEEAARRLELQRTLEREGLVAKEQIHAAEIELRTAQAMAAASRAEQNAAGAARNMAEVESDGLAVRERRVAVLESDIATFRAELAVAEANLEGALIRAPDEGAVVHRIAEPGVSIVVGQPIISLWVGVEIWVEAWVDEDDLAHVRVGSPATVTLKPYPDREFSGVVESISVSTDFELPDSEIPQPRQSRMRDAPVVGVRIRLDEPEEDMFPGLSAVVGIEKMER